MEWGLSFLIVLLSAAVQAGTGFGFAILAIPLLLLVHQDHSAVSVALGLSLISSVSTLPRVMRDTDTFLLGKLLIGSLFGLPLGGIVFVMLDIYWLKLVAGICIICFAIPLLMNIRLPLGKGKGIGFASGFLGSSIGMPGPPVVLYLLSNKIGKQTFRGTSIAYYSIVNAISFTIQMMSGRVNVSEMSYAVMLIPAIFVGQAIGLAVTRDLNQLWFRRATFVLLIATGVQAVLSSI